MVEYTKLNYFYKYWFLCIIIFNAPLILNVLNAQNVWFCIKIIKIKPVLEKTIKTKKHKIYQNQDILKNQKIIKTKIL